MSTNYTKLKTNLRLCIQRLKMAEKKKTELAQKSRREIGEYLAASKIERARIRVEHIIREDYLVEAMELVEMYCDLLITRFGLIQQMKTLDDGLAEAISSIIWIAPRLQSDIQELKVVADLLTQKYGKVYAQAARENSLNSVSNTLITKMSVEAPPRILVEKYLIEISKSLNVPFEPDEELLKSDGKPIIYGVDAVKDLDNLIEFNCEPIESTPIIPPLLPNQAPVAGPSNYSIVRPIGFDLPSAPSHTPQSQTPSPQHRSKLDKENEQNLNDTTTKISQSPPPNYDSILSKQHGSDLLNLPDVPLNSGKGDSEDDIDFDDLAKRFEALKKAK